MNIYGKDEEFDKSIDNLIKCYKDYYENIRTILIPIKNITKEELLELYPYQREYLCDFVKKKCECGADKCGSPGHSNWCPKHNE